MFKDSSLFDDPASLADSIRNVARLAHHTLNSTNPSQRDLRDLSRRLSRLNLLTRREPTGPLHQWVENLGRQVDARIDRTARVPVASC